jgi:Putative zinc-binding metallo-peptidase
MGFAWEDLPDNDLLKLRICDLRVRIHGSELEERVQQLYHELEARGLPFRPDCYLGDEWFSPEGSPVIAIPFYLAHPRLKQLELHQMLEVEGGTSEWCMQILRHECGHAYDHAHQFSSTEAWVEMFGNREVEYEPETYRPRPYSKSFVRHLPNWYAQAHPDEDFAETFAVWLRPRSNWRTRYIGWPALKKLRYVDELMREIAGKRPLLTNREKVDPLGKFKETLGEYYKNKRELYLVDPPRTYDRDLLRLFSADPKHRHAETAASFIRRNRTRVRELVAKWTGEYQLTVDAVLDDMIARCRKLKLRAVGSERRLVIEFTTLLTAKTMHALFGPSRRRWIAL